MDDSARRAGAGHHYWYRSRMATLAVMLLCLAAPTAGAQEDDANRDAGLRDADLEEIARQFGVENKAIEAVERLGGKIRYDQDRPPKRVVGIDLSGTKVTDADLAALKDPLKLLPKLEYLDLSNTGITNAGLTHLPGLTGDLDLSNTGITDAGLVHLRGLNKLKSLDLSNTGITDAGLDHLRGLTGLFRLNLTRTRVTDAGVTGVLRGLPHTRVSRRPIDLKYFPDGAIDPEEGDHFLSDWYSEDLYAMKEPSLWSLSREDPQAVAYRFLWFPSFDPALAVRIVPSGEGATLHAVQLGGGSGYRGGKPVNRRTVKLSRDQWSELRRRVDDARFWSLPKHLPTHGLFADGAGYVVEAVEEGKYHAVSAENPDLDDRCRRYKALCEEMIKLSGMDVMGVWKEYWNTDAPRNE